MSQTQRPRVRKSLSGRWVASSSSRHFLCQLIWRERSLQRAMRDTGGSSRTDHYPNVRRYKAKGTPSTTLMPLLKDRAVHRLLLTSIQTMSQLRHIPRRGCVNPRRISPAGLMVSGEQINSIIAHVCRRFRGWHRWIDVGWQRLCSIERCRRCRVVYMALAIGANG